jgi:hypothetical protein
MPTTARGLSIGPTFIVIRKDRGDLLEQDSAIARQRFVDFRARMDADPRIPPRAAGHDAP